jgi:hypothetical protein
VLPAAWAGYLLLVGMTGWYRTLVYLPLEPLFADLMAVLAANDCHRLGYDVYAHNPCDPWARPHVYGAPWLWLSELGIGRPELLRLGLAINGLFMLATCWLLRRARPLQALYALLIVGSPAVLLGMERANNDLVILLLLVAALGLAAVSERAGRVAGILLAVAATALKLYPAVLLAELVLGARGRSWRIACGLFAGTVFLAWLAWALPEVRLLLHSAPRPEGPLTFGAALLFKLAGVDSYRAAGQAAGLILLGTAFLLGRKLVVPAQLAGSYAAALASAAGLVLAFTFVANTNFDYRLVFVVPALPLLFALRDHWPARGLARRLSGLGMACAALALWAALPKKVLYAAAQRGELPAATLHDAIFAVTLAERLAEWVLVLGLLTLTAAIITTRLARAEPPGNRRDPAG